MYDIGLRHCLLQGHESLFCRPPPLSPPARLSPPPVNHDYLSDFLSGPLFSSLFLPLSDSPRGIDPGLGAEPGAAGVLKGRRRDDQCDQIGRQIVAQCTGRKPGGIPQIRRFFCSLELNANLNAGKVLRLGYFAGKKRYQVKFPSRHAAKPPASSNGPN